MPSGIPLSTSVLVGTQKPTDARYGPYASTALALADLTSVYRYKGLTVGIETGGVITEYWFNDGIADTDFVPKSTVVSSYSPFSAVFPTVTTHTIPSGSRNRVALYANSTTLSVTVNLPENPIEGDTLTIVYSASVGQGTLTVSGVVLRRHDAVSFVAELDGGSTSWRQVFTSVQADWSEASDSSPSFIRNKPTTPPAHNHAISEITGLQSELDQLLALNLALS